MVGYVGELLWNVYCTYNTDACLHSDVVKTAATCMYIQIYKTAVSKAMQGHFLRHAAINAIYCYPNR